MMNKLVGTAEIQHRALKLRIYPTKEQEILINKTGSAKKKPARFTKIKRAVLAASTALSHQKDSYQTNP